MAMDAAQAFFLGLLHGRCCGLSLEMEIHGLKTVAVAAFHGTARFHLPPHDPGQAQPVCLEILSRINGAGYESVIQLA